MRILLATTNVGKLREFRQILTGLAVESVALDAFPIIREPEETESTFAGNAALKAQYYAAKTGLPTVADDSGLEVDALGGAPGVLSARYAGEPKDDGANNAKLLAALSGVDAGRRTARFRCAAALATPDGFIRIETGTIEGRIIDAPRGSNGFGYDPLFGVDDYGCTTAEMPPDLKNTLSHRGQALRKLRPHIEALIKTERS
ncbi:MAG: dITP/XTP pyrophosphatase [Phycisphaerae bacterium]|nr:dITP/XTP pyrophosphatase [Phycisphaerae bacterium]